MLSSFFFFFFFFHVIAVSLQIILDCSKLTCFNSEELVFYYAGNSYCGIHGVQHLYFCRFRKKE